MKLKKIGKYFHAEFTTATGTKRTATTRSTERGEAMRIARDAGVTQLEHAAKAGRLTQAVIGQIVTGKKLTLAKAMNEFYDWQRSVGKSERTIGNNIWVHKRWLEWDPSIATLPPSAITEKHISRYINAVKFGAGAQSRRAMLATLRNLFAFCSAKGWIVGNPAGLVAVNYDLLSHEQKEPETVVPFTEPEYRRLIKHINERIDDTEKELDRIRSAAPEDGSGYTHGSLALSKRLARLRFWLVASHLDWETGLRIGDVAELEWDCFKIAGKVIVHTGKTNKRVAVPISEALSTAITEIPISSDKYLFPEQRIAQRGSNRTTLCIQFIRLCRAAGIQDKSFHSLRHGYVTRMRKAGKTLEDIGELVGHSNTKTTARYVH